MRPSCAATPAIELESVPLYKLPSGKPVSDEVAGKVVLIESGRKRRTRCVRLRDKKPALILTTGGRGGRAAGARTGRRPINWTLRPSP